jgi:hypothetical protein
LPELGGQMNWLAAEAVSRNIRAALFMGDLTEHNSRPSGASCRRRCRTPSGSCRWCW